MHSRAKHVTAAAGHSFHGPLAAATRPPLPPHRTTDAPCCAPSLALRPQAVDPSDPLVQQLVQDKSFLTAVQTSQLHAAATAAVRLLRVSHSSWGCPPQHHGCEQVDKRPRAHTACAAQHPSLPPMLLLPQAHFSAAGGEFKRPPDRRRDAYDDPPARPAAPAARAHGGGLVVQRQVWCGR